MKKNIKYIIAGVVIIILILVVAWKNSQGLNVTVNENSEPDYTEERENVTDEEDKSADGRYAESNIEADDDGFEWNWSLLESEKIYDDGFYLLRNDKIYSLNKVNLSENKLSGKGYLYDRIREDNKNTNQDPAQLAMQKSMNWMMPLILGFTFFIIPIPAGVLLYLVVSNCFQVVQTIVINKQLELEDEAKANKVSDIDVENAKKIEEK